MLGKSKTYLLKALRSFSPSRVKQAFIYLQMICYVSFAEVVNAATVNTAAGKSDLQSILSNQTFQTTITVGFIVLAFVKWIDYFQNFNASSALKDIITPAFLTFLALFWGDVLSWFGLM